MSYMARWGPKGFLLSPSMVISLGDFSTSVELNVDSNTNNILGLLLRPVSFSVVYARAAGTDPRAHLQEWESLVGQSHPLYIGGKRFGPNSLILKKVDSSDYVFSPKGDVSSLTISVSLEEDTNSQATALTDTTTGSAGGVTVDASTAEKRSAMNATASAADRARLSSR